MLERGETGVVGISREIRYVIIYKLNRTLKKTLLAVIQ
jgi:hypothetical protein